MLFAVADQPFSQVKLSLTGPIKYISRATSPSLNKHLQPHAAPPPPPPTPPPPPPPPPPQGMQGRHQDFKLPGKYKNRRGIKQLGVSFGSIFLLYFSFESSWGTFLVAGKNSQPLPLNDSPGSGSARMVQMFIRLEIMMITMMLMMVMMKTVMTSLMIMATMMMNCECLFSCKFFALFCNLAIS